MELMQTMLTDSDRVILNSPESYLKQVHPQPFMNQQEKIMYTGLARDNLYSDIARRTVHVAAYILSADLESDPFAQGLHMSLSKHVLDPAFITILMTHLSQCKSYTGRDLGVVGAYLCKVMNKWIDTNCPKTVEKTAINKKGENKAKAEKADVNLEEDRKKKLEPVKHVFMAVHTLLHTLIDRIQHTTSLGSDEEILALAAAIAMDNEYTIQEIFSSDLPVTAEVAFALNPKPDIIIKSALLLPTKLIPATMTANQSAFLESLKRWVYEKLNEQGTQFIYQFLVATYGKHEHVDVSQNFINPKDCGTQYSNLLCVAKQMINK